MKPKQVILRILLPGLFLWTILWACNTPSIPNPPPGPEVISILQEDDEHWRFEIIENVHIRQGSQITVHNLIEQVWVGGIAGPNGTFLSQPFVGTEGDIIQMKFTYGDEGGSMCYILQPGTPAVEDPRCGN